MAIIDLHSLLHQSLCLRDGIVTVYEDNSLPNMRSKHRIDGIGRDSLWCWVFKAHQHLRQQNTERVWLVRTMSCAGTRFQRTIVLPIASPRSCSSIVTDHNKTEKSWVFAEFFLGFSRSSFQLLFLPALSIWRLIHISELTVTAGGTSPRTFSLLRTPRRVTRYGGAVRVRPHAQISDTAPGLLAYQRENTRRVEWLLLHMCPTRNLRLSCITTPQLQRS